MLLKIYEPSSNSSNQAGCNDPNSILYYNEKSVIGKLDLYQTVEMESAAVSVKLKNSVVRNDVLVAGLNPKFGLVMC